MPFALSNNVNNEQPQTSELDMNLIRFFIAVLLLLLSGQSQALFMPAGFQVSTNVTDVSNDAGC